MKKNERLIDCIPYKAPDSNWYMRLIYGYEDEKGKHEVVFPKVKLPVSTDCVPRPASSDCGSCFGLFHSGGCHIAGLSEIPLYEDTWHGAVIRGVKDAACAFDIVTDPAVHEMTLDEIEEKLGYKVKIVNKESR